MSLFLPTDFKSHYQQTGFLWEYKECEVYFTAGQTGQNEDKLESVQRQFSIHHKKILGSAIYVIVFRNSFLFLRDMCFNHLSYPDCPSAQLNLTLVKNIDNNIKISTFFLIERRELSKEEQSPISSPSEEMPKISSLWTEVKLFSYRLFYIFFCDK